MQRTGAITLVCNMRTIFRIIRFAFESIFRNGWLALATTTMLTLTLLTVNIIVAVNVVSHAALTALNEELSVDIYFVPETSVETQSAVRGYLLSLPQVRDVKAMTSAQALEDFKTTFAGNDTIIAALEEVGGNPFTDSVRIYARDGSDLRFVLEAVKSPEFAPHIRETVTHEALIASVEKINERADKLQYAGFAVATLFALIAMLIVFNTIRVAIYVHRDEIAVMRLVGARNSFIRGPFIVEAAVYSIAATIIVAGAIILGLALARSSLATFLSGVPIDLSAYFTMNAPMIFGLQCLGLFILSWLTTILALRRYLHS